MKKDGDAHTRDGETVAKVLTRRTNGGLNLLKFLGQWARVRTTRKRSH